MHRNFTSYLAVVALGVGGCAGGGAGSMRAAAPIAPGEATTTPKSALSITISVPKRTKAAPSARRRPAYVSAGSMSIVFTLDQPELDDPDARHRTFEQDLQPGDNVIMIPSPDGSLTLTASTYDQKGGKGDELGYSDPQTITIDEGPPQDVDILLNPIIVTAIAAPFDVQVFSLFSTETAECTGVEGQYLLTGADASGNVVDGEGRFLDTSHNDVTVTAQGGFLVTSFTEIGYPGVSITTSSATEVTGGSFLDNVPEFDLPNGGGDTPAIIASASSANVAPSTAILAAVNNVNGVGCNVGSGG